MRQNVFQNFSVIQHGYTVYKYVFSVLYTSCASADVSGQQHYSIESLLSLEKKSFFSLPCLLACNIEVYVNTTS